MTSDYRRVAEYFYLTGEDEETVVHWAKMTATDILRETTWAGRYIPLIPVFGEDLEIDGVRHVAGIVRHSIDSQRMYNYWVSAATGRIALMPLAPYMATAEEIAGYEDIYKTANVKRHAVMYYNFIVKDGVPVPPPARQQVSAEMGDMAMMIRQADNDLKATTGIFDASLGQRGPEQSGKAVLARQKQSDISTFGFGDNLARAMRFAGRQLVDLIPKIYDQPRLQRIVNPDGTVDHAVIHNGPNQLAGARALATQSFPGHSDPYTKIYDLSVGTYDVVVSVGPSYQTKRQEAAAAQIELIKAFPNIMAVAGDILVGNQDWPGAREIAKRMKALLPPALQDDPNADPETRLAQAQGQIQSLSQQHQALTVELNKMSDILRSKRFELESKERIALMQIQGQLVVADLKAHVDGAMQLLQAQTRAIEQRLALLHESQSIDTEAAGGVPIQTPAVPPALTSSLHAGPGAPIAPTAQGPGGQP